MESLAYLAVVMLSALLVSTAAALIVTFRSRTKRGHVIASLCAAPGLLVGLRLLVSVDSTGARLFGVLGMLGFALPAYRAYRATSAANDSSSA